MRSIVALAVAAVIVALIGWIIVRLAWWPPRSASTRVAFVSAALVLAAIAFWTVFILPAYWD